VVLDRVDDRYFGGIDRNCNSDLRGARYATSGVVIKEDQLIIWDRGFDENDRQFWGSEKGEYVFMKKNSIKLSPGF